MGNITEYGYDLEKGVLQWCKAPEDTDATRTNYTHDELFRTATAAATTDTGDRGQGDGSLVSFVRIQEAYKEWLIIV